MVRPSAFAAVSATKRINCNERVVVTGPGGLVPDRRKRNPTSTTMGARVRAERRARGWTLTELAARCGVSAATLSKVENGRAGLGADTLMCIAAGLGVSL